MNTCGSPAFSEREDAGVLKVPAEHRPDPDGVAEPRHARLQRADAPHQQVDGHPGLAGTVQRVDDLLVDDRVDLDPDAAGDAFSRVLGFGVDALEQRLAQVQGGDQEPLELLLDRVTGEFVEQSGEVLADLVIRRQQPQVFVKSGGLRVVVAGADVAVVLQHPVLPAHHEGEFAVRLEPDQAVDDVNARFLEFACPADVRRFVEACLDLDQGEHGFAGLGRLNERLDDGAVATGAVQGLLDGEYRRVAGRLLEERLHAGGEGFVRVMQQDAMLRDGRENVRGRVRLGRQEIDARRRHVLGVLQHGAVDLDHLVQAAEVQRGRQPVHLLLGDVEFAHEQAERQVVHVVGDLEADRRPEPTLQQLPFEGLDEVLRLVFLDLDILVPGDPELVVLEHVHAGEQLVEVVRDEVFERDEPQQPAARHPAAE